MPATGYGNELNAIRTVREYEKRGVAGIHIEDQGFPKKCGHLEDKTIAPLEDYIAKIRAAVSAKVDKDFLIIARTVRARRWASKRRSGAPMPRSRPAPTWPSSRRRRRSKGATAVPKLVKGPCMLNMVWKGKTPDLSMEGGPGSDTPS